VGNKIAVATVGALLLAAGVLLLPLPGPGSLVIVASFGVLGREFAWAKRTQTRWTGRFQRVSKAMLGQRRSGDASPTEAAAG
jgi:hypothetical protein